MVKHNQLKAGEAKLLPASSGIAGIPSVKAADSVMRESVRRFLALSVEGKSEKKEDETSESCESRKVAVAFAPPALLQLTKSLLHGAYRTVLGTVVVANTSLVGVINFSIMNSNLSGLTDFPLFASLFDEFFVHSAHVTFVPRSRYQYVPATTSPGTSVVNTLLTMTQLFHGVGGYASAATAMENATTKIFSTADPFSFWWRNNESPAGGVVVNSSSSGVLPSQGWCLTASGPASLYQGNIQGLGATPIGPGTGVVSFADIAVQYDVTFRNRA